MRQKTKVYFCYVIHDSSYWYMSVYDLTTNISQCIIYPIWDFIVSEKQIVSRKVNSRTEGIMNNSWVCVTLIVNSTVSPWGLTFNILTSYSSVLFHHGDYYFYWKVYVHCHSCLPLIIVLQLIISRDVSIHSASFSYQFLFSNTIFYRGVPWSATDCPSLVWCRGITTCRWYSSLFFLF